MRSCPLVSLIGFTFTAVGSGFALSQREAIEEAFKLLRIGDDFGHWGKVAVASEHYLWPIYITTIAFNSVALCVAFADSGKTREYLFGPVHSYIGWIFQLVAGPGLAMIVCVVAFLAFLLHLAIVCAILPSTPIILLAYAACKKGGFVIAGLATALELSGMVGNAFEIVVLGDFCKVQKHFSIGITVLVAGGIMSVVGQVMMLVGATYNHVRLYFHMKENTLLFNAKDTPSYASAGDKVIAGGPPAAPQCLTSSPRAAPEDSPKEEVMSDAP